MSRAFVVKTLTVGAVSLLLAGASFAQSTTAKQTLPVKMGTSGGSFNDASRLYCCGGTLGALVLYNGLPHILSNNHVLARSGSAANGEDTIQPALIDVNCNGATSNVIGDFVGNLVPLGTGNVDVGLSKARTGTVDLTGAILNVGVPCSNVQTATIGLPVAKSGRTTGYTTGTVQAVNVSTTIQYQKGCNQGKKFNASFTNQIAITPGTFSAGGDSGSLIVSNDGTKNPVGLLFAGSSSATIANRIQDVVSALSAGGNTVSFVGASCAAAPSSVGLISGISEAEVEYISSIKESHEKGLLSRPGVVGVGVGKVSDDEESTEGAIILYVDAAKGTRPKGFPKQIDGVKVRIIPTDPFVARCG